MISSIEQDHQRFRQIVRGKIRKDLRKFLSRGELLGREGKRFVAIPVHDIDIPTFRYGDNSGGVGMGEGGEGDSVVLPIFFELHGMQISTLRPKENEDSYITRQARRWPTRFTRRAARGSENGG